MQVKINDELEVEVVPNEEHEWLLSTKDVAEGYGLSESGVRKAKERYQDELEEGKHYLTVTDSHAQNITGNSKARTVTMWTKRGVARLGFFIKTPMAKEFRDWAEDYIIDGQSKRTAQSQPALPQTYLEALKELVAKEEMLQLQAPKVEVYDAQTPMPSKGRT